MDNRENPNNLDKRLMQDKIEREKQAASSYTGIFIAIAIIVIGLFIWLFVSPNRTTENTTTSTTQTEQTTTPATTTTPAATAP